MYLQRVARVGVRHLRLADGLGRAGRVIGIENQLRQLSISTQSRPSLPAVGSSSTVLSEQARSFATKPGRPKGSTSTGAKKTTKSKTAKSKTTKSKTAAAPKKKKPLTEKQKEAKEKRKEADHIKELKKTALTAPKKLPEQARGLAFPTAFALIKQNEPEVKDAFKKTVQALNELPQYELERYQAQARENRATNEAAYESWLKSHTPLQIKEANAARRTLARLQNKQVRLIKDDRLVKKPKNAFMIFSSERRSAGDFMHLRAVDTSTRISEEWKNMTEREKEPYIKSSANDLERYYREYEQVYGEPAPYSKSSSPA